MCGDDADDGKGILQGSGEHTGEQIDGVGQDIGVVTDEDQFILKHEQCPDIQEVFQSEHAEHRVYPLADVVSLAIVPISHQCQFLLVDQPKLVLLVECHFLELQIPIAMIKQLDQSLHLKPTVCLLDGQLDVLFVVFVDGQTLHLYDVYEVSQDLLVETEEGVV